MEALLARLAAWSSRRRWGLVAVWAALLAASAWPSLHQTDHLTGGGWDVPGSESARAAELIAEFPRFNGIRFALLVESSSAARTRAAVTSARVRLARFPDVRPYGRPQPFEGEKAVLVPFLYTGDDTNGIDVATDLREEFVSDAGGVRTRVLGAPAIYSNFQEVSKEQLATAEAIGFPLILVILVASFGTLVAAAAPLVLGFVAVFLTGAVIYLLSLATDMSVFVTNMASMLGIGVAVDYSLFVVSRFRRRLGEGATSAEALREALASSGTAVVFSGATVVVSLASLFLVPVTAVRSLAAGAIIVVAIAVLATVTLLPALLALAGHRVERFRVPLLAGREGGVGERFWPAWTGTVMRRPVLALALAVPFMVALAAPTLSLHTENHGVDQLPKDAEVRAAMERAAELAGPGFFGPVWIFTDDRAAAAEIAGAASAVEGVARAEGPLSAENGGRHLVIATLALDPDSSEARDVYHELARVSERIAGGDGDVVVGGQTAFALDVEEPLVGGLWKVLLFVLALSYVVLLVLLRSVLLPLKAVLMNLLSVGAAYGVLVAVFQWGWLDWVGYDSPGYVETIVPAMVLAVTFGLSMDYEVFLLTRIRERYLAGAGNERAVAEGLAASARVITAAALIMAAVFGAFVIAGAPSVKEIGLGLAVAILLDATIVRLVIVPATMRLLGRWNWWFPGAALQRLPRIGELESPVGKPER